MALARRLVATLTNAGDVVLDPYAGVASSGVAALLEGRRFIGAELDEDYAVLAEERLQQTRTGTVRVRDDKPHTFPTPKAKWLSGPIISVSSIVLPRIRYTRAPFT